MRKRNILILILLLVIGFASVTTTLVLNGTIGIGVKLDDFNVIFIEALLDDNDSEKISISEDKKSITFTTDRFSNLGDSARLDYKVKNTSTQYDADVIINCTNEVSEYVKVTSYFDGKELPLNSSVNMKAQEIKNGYLNVELVQAYAGEDTSVEIKCRIVVTATSRESYAYSLNFDSAGGNKIDDKGVILNESYGELPIPEREGYNFLGWYDEEDNKVDENTKLNKKENKTLYAKWEIKIYPVGIITNSNGSCESSTINVAYENTANIKITPDKNYYLSSVKCSEGYTVEEFNSKVPTYSSQTIKIKNNNADIEGTCTFEFSQGIFEYGYTGNAQTFTVPLDGNYKLETRGAQGGSNSSVSGVGGKGAYVRGNILLLKQKMLFLYIGGSGQNGPVYSNIGGYNGGGGNQTQDKRGANGGGATDIRLVNGDWNNFDSLKSRIMVAGAGGGCGISNTGAYGGMGFSKFSNLYGGNGTQTNGGLVGTGYTHTSGATSGGFGYGGNGGAYIVGAGGSGYYGGAGGQHITPYTSGGGSSFISGHTGCDAILKTSTSSNIIHSGQPNHYSGLVFTNTNMIAGNASMPTHDGKSTMVGNSGNGYAKITLISID